MYGDEIYLCNKAIKNNKLIDLYKAEYGKSYFSNLIIESKIVFELNVVISYIAHNLQKKRL